MPPHPPWLCYGADALPDRATALAAPLRAFPSWYLRLVCTCGRERFLAETHMTLAGHGDRRIGDILARLRHDRCGGVPASAELVTGIPGISSGTVRRISLIEP